MSFAHRLAARHLIYTALELIQQMQNDATFREVVEDSFSLGGAGATMRNLAIAKAELVEAYERFTELQIHLE